ncbi:NADH-quinone oxidoreductase subunit C [Kyrpidia tusciae]|uniref:NADH-quinone oxidoreductase subunit C n=1 Tax=Kyrpidia tusciae (strain DSM 2912 / NBRC 15312 / T2) TaxID=562970 RepID=D5WV45_KYRT2|nr:NADH-quinone oxidoreductase subunit C [Kyrpidia tusciae]ADG07517.1 NADH (or F420H2) dehydrogenase, subunit C [Kyrpidia tusciae DSM 2912]
MAYDPQALQDHWGEALARDLETVFGPHALEDARVADHMYKAAKLDVVPERWLPVAQYLRNTPAWSFDYLNDLHAVDLGGEFRVNYFLESFTHGHMLAVSVTVPRDNPRVPSVTEIWPTADWHEREAYDLFGILFVGHPNLKRILLPEDWEGHPLRKDYAPKDKEVKQ